MAENKKEKSKEKKKQKNKAKKQEEEKKSEEKKKEKKKKKEKETKEKKEEKPGELEEDKEKVDELKEKIIKEEKAKKKRLEVPEPKAGVKKTKTGKPTRIESNTFTYIAVALLVLIALGAGVYLAMSFLPGFKPLIAPTPTPDQNALGKKPLSSEMQEALREAGKDVNREPRQIVEGSEQVPGELINTQESEGTEKFTDLDNLLKVSFEVTDKDSATIEEISTLSEGRITVTPPGDYSVQLLNENGEILYELPFQAVFVIMSNPPTKIEKIKYSFVLPIKENAVKVAITKKRQILTEKEI